MLRKSLCTAFLMYSRIPVPQVAWTEENRRYALCFFPLVGAVTGGLLIGLRALCTFFAVGQAVFAAAGMLLPLLVTGGIHMDGFCDVTDARASCAERERKLAIMSDPHIGSFALIYGAAYLIVQTALLSQIWSLRQAAAVGIGFVLSRALSGLTAVTYPAAKHEGTLYSFVKPAHKRRTAAALLLVTIAGGAGLLLLSQAAGGTALALAGAVLLWYRRMACSHFGGITGDTAGWFLQLCELAVLLPFALI